jgi:hypothetical protein
VSKTQLNFKQEYNPRITHKLIKQAETSYNPILQKYQDKAYEGGMQAYEKETFIDTLAKNKVRNALTFRIGN